ncbi:hypothetical protein [Streptomyces alfalfae]|nr:hypothetical protein [Streptomyces alfalfae]
MPEITPEAMGPAPVQLTPEATEPALVPAGQVKSEEIGALSVEYRDGQPVIVVSGGTYLPARLTVVDGGGSPVAAYEAGPITTTRLLSITIGDQDVTDSASEAGGDMLYVNSLSF